ncbi:MAG: hypothetical protein ABIN93_02120 [Ginsengibacter sp.]
MSNQIYSVTGQVVDINTGQGIPNLRVEAWDLNKDHQDSFGSSNVDENGRFILCLDLKRSGLSNSPNLYFKVYRDTELLANTEDTVVLKAGEDKEVLIEINVVKAHPEGKDRVNAQQLFTGVDFFANSDFTGLFSETKKKAGTRVGFVSDMIMNTVRRSDIKPIKVGTTKEHDVINQPVESATQKLTKEKVIVNEVLPYSPQLNKESLINLGSAPPRLKEGQKINLYEENGKVRYYSIVKENVSTADLTTITKEHTEQLTKLNEELDVTKESVAKKNAEIAQVTREHKDQLSQVLEQLTLAKENTAKKDAEIAEVSRQHSDQLLRMQEELTATKDISAQKNTEFARLQEELKTLRTDQANMATLLKPENFNKFIKDFQIGQEKVIAVKSKRRPPQ